MAEMAIACASSVVNPPPRAYTRSTPRTTSGSRDAYVIPPPSSPPLLPLLPLHLPDFFSSRPTHAHHLFLQENCGSVADRLIEYELILVGLDLALHRLPAWRHILFNRKPHAKLQWPQVRVLEAKRSGVVVLVHGVCLGEEEKCFILFLRMFFSL